MKIGLHGLIWVVMAGGTACTLTNPSDAYTDKTDVQLAVHTKPNLLRVTVQRDQADATECIGSVLRNPALQASHPTLRIVLTTGECMRRPGTSGTMRDSPDTYLVQAPGDAERSFGVRGRYVMNLHYELGGTGWRPSLVVLLVEARPEEPLGGFSAHRPQPWGEEAVALLPSNLHEGYENRFFELSISARNVKIQHEHDRGVFLWQQPATNRSAQPNWRASTSSTELAPGLYGAPVVKEARGEQTLVGLLTQPSAYLTEGEYAREVGDRIIPITPALIGGLAHHVGGWLDEAETD